MKYVFILFLLLIPLVYADNVLEAKQASLDLNANNFLIQMDVAINYSQSKEIDVIKLNEIKNSFSTKLEETLKATSIQDFEKKQEEMQQLANEFKSIVRSNTEGFLTNLKTKIREIKYDKTKETTYLEKRNKLISERINTKTEVLNNYIIEQESNGKDPKIHKILLKAFKEKQQNLNSTEIGSTIDSSKFWGALTSLKNALVAEMRKVNTT